MLSTEFDIFTMREAIKAVRRFVAAQAWSGWILEETSPSSEAQTDAEIEAYIRATCFTVNHVTCTVPMGKSGEASSGNGALNSDLTVKGTVGLRVVDASAFVRSFLHSIASSFPLTFFFSLIKSHLYPQHTLKSQHTYLQNGHPISSKAFTNVSHVLEC